MTPDRPWAAVQVADDLAVTTLDNAWSPGEAHYLYHEIFTHDDYLTGLPPLRRDAVVVDAGANIGLFAIRVARACPDARIVAIEPAPTTCALLRRNLTEHQVEGASVHEVALGAQPGRATLTVYENLPANSTTRPAEKPAEWTASTRALEPDPARAAALLGTQDVEVEVVRLADLLPDSVDLLKVDVEGAELDVLRGLAATDWPRIAVVVAEVHDVDGRLADVLELLRANGFDCSTRTPAMMAAELRHHIVVAQRP